MRSLTTILRAREEPVSRWSYGTGGEDLDNVT